MATLSIPVEKNYNENLINTIRLLHNVHNELLAQVVNLALSGDLQALREGEKEKMALDLRYSDLTELPDGNVQHMIELIEVLKSKLRAIVAVNQIETADL